MDGANKDTFDSNYPKIADLPTVDDIEETVATEEKKAPSTDNGNWAKDPILALCLQPIRSSRQDRPAEAGKIEPHFRDTV